MSNRQRVTTHVDTACGVRILRVVRQKILNVFQSRNVQSANLQDKLNLPRKTVNTERIMPDIANSISQLGLIVIVDSNKK